MGKICSKCKKEKPKFEFGKKKYNTDGLNHYCKKCENNRNKERYKNQNYREKVKYGQIRRNYGLTKDNYLKMFEDQNYECKICESSVIPLTKDSHVDHCHRTNVIRGILCAKCNRLLGEVSDNVEHLNKMIQYIITADHAVNKE